MNHQPTSQADGHADTLIDRVYALIAESLDVMRLEVMPGCVLRDDLGADDTDIDRLRRTIDRTLGCYVTKEDAEAWREVADVVGYVQRRMGA